MVYKIITHIQSESSLKRQRAGKQKQKQQEEASAC